MDYGSQYSYFGLGSFDEETGRQTWKIQGASKNSYKQDFAYAIQLAKLFPDLYHFNLDNIGKGTNSANLTYSYDATKQDIRTKYATMFGKDHKFTGQELVDFISARGYSFGDITSALGSRQNRAAANGRDFTIKKANWDYLAN